MQGRVFGFSLAVAHVRAEQQDDFDCAGVRMPLADGYIAATARKHGLTIVTGNDRHFRRPGLKVLNPFTELA
jgi:predicted nucleic acid-binding protein